MSLLGIIKEIKLRNCLKRELILWLLKAKRSFNKEEHCQLNKRFRKKKQ
jgi:hypothetical protein